MINIQRLQSKSDAQKAVYATAASIVVATLLFMVWGYNFVNGGGASNIAGGASSVARAVGSVELDNSNFNKTLEQLTELLRPEASTDDFGDESVSAQYRDVFINDATPVQKPGENPADALY